METERKCVTVRREWRDRQRKKTERERQLARPKGLTSVQLISWPSSEELLSGFLSNAQKHNKNVHNHLIKLSGHQVYWPPSEPESGSPRGLQLTEVENKSLAASQALSTSEESKHQRDKPHNHTCEWKHNIITHQQTSKNVISSRLGRPYTVCV